ncbi:unnamed protein product [Rotaria socialis]|uniref:Damage-inducible protein DinB n=1 Tax=Rotaria socialis TaxID=392032 RepID=A0A817X0C2_9BILA|nr:unnamed protein product [Rotaria socialis]CAF3362106.1 unnamed protein product [Rotaria socialis]CAF3415931.1 unnamed protein product [Rotaria socialis]CAF3785663.1 unnamed protein product [Rotaria socialis]CAF4313602.1 unnamed protein product [Rotaria socialis]
MNAYKQHFLRMAIYNRWAFRQLYSTLDNHISDENYYADNGLYFRSIHGTLVHLLLSSKLWYNRLTATTSHSIQDEKYPYEINSYWSRPANEWEQAITDRKDLYEKILTECDRWIDYTKELNDQRLMNEETFDYIDTNGNKHERNRGAALDHVFNHTTHHRGQITAIITKYVGQDASPILDLPAMPTDEYTNIIN